MGVTVAVVCCDQVVTDVVERKGLTWLNGLTGFHRMQLWNKVGVIYTCPLFKTMPLNINISSMWRVHADALYSL